MRGVAAVLCGGSGVRVLAWRLCVGALLRRVAWGRVAWARRRSRRVGALVLRTAWGWLGWPGGDRLSRILGCSIMGAGGFHVRVRDGIGCWPAAMATRPSQPTPRNACALACPRNASALASARRLRCRAWGQGLVRVRRCRVRGVGPWRSGWLLCMAGLSWAVPGQAGSGWDEPFGRLGPVS